MFNTRDDYYEIDFNEIHNPYVVGKYVQNRNKRNSKNNLYR